jgi:hypothetical protein
MVTIPQKKEDAPVQKILIPKLVYDPLFGVKINFIKVEEEIA